MDRWRIRVYLEFYVIIRVFVSTRPVIMQQTGEKDANAPRDASTATTALGNRSNTHFDASKKLIPLFDRILVTRVKAAERTASGLFIPEKAQETLNEGLVVAVGQGAPDKDGVVKPMSIKEGDRILLPPYGGNTIKLGADEFMIFKETEILAKFAN
ncbi:hypothetical protein SmJEL517_g05960 [Synchytrium microbalum]|uniref:Chaperonin GroES n=1 Tax=Synchytrium microbalum TaxID=1806994 RepID=A0A507BTU4_9FUNG|nr:uncharacterized protein SmJEL517_g05960 [Synchytrium microbalum]TPX30479.1 hypothetical protein SmJEL517_g05960 [Synchytrium microbalum]